MSAVTNNAIKCALANGAAHYRKCVEGYLFVHLPDMNFSTMLQFKSGFPSCLTSCKSMSRGAARRAIKSARGLDILTRRFYESIVNAQKTEGGIA